MQGSQRAAESTSLLNLRKAPGNRCRGLTMDTMQVFVRTGAPTAPPALCIVWRVCLSLMLTCSWCTRADKTHTLQLGSSATVDDVTAAIAARQGAQSRSSRSVCSYRQPGTAARQGCQKLGHTTEGLPWPPSSACWFADGLQVSAAVLPVRAAGRPEICARRSRLF